MSDIIKYISSLFPGPVNKGKYFSKNGLDVIFPFYHSVSDKELLHMKPLYTIRNVQQFEADLEYLLKYFEPVIFSEYIAGNVSSNSGRPKMVLSFDDGLIQCYEEVMPILLKKGIPAVFFLNNAFIDNRAMFYRFKVSLLLHATDGATETEKKKAAALLHTDVSSLKTRLLSVSYVEREITDQIAAAWGYSYDDYIREHPIYMSSMHIRKMLAEGFEFGSHGIDHPLFSLLTAKEAANHIKDSVEDLQHRYQLDYKYFAFPFTDYGVQDNTIEGLFKENVIDAGFGTAGLKDDKWKNYYQRVPMEMFGMDAKKVLNGELNRRRLRSVTGRNKVNRGPAGNAEDLVE